MEFSSHFKKLPPTIQSFLKFAVEKVKPQKVILFGSRARGTHRVNSDFDIAVQGLLYPEQWNHLLVSLEHENYTLYKIDLVRIEDLSDDYKINIQKEGLILYG